MKSGFWLSDEQWSVIEPLLPKSAAGARRVISDIIHVLSQAADGGIVRHVMGRQRRSAIAFTDGQAGVSGTEFWQP